MAASSNDKMMDCLTHICEFLPFGGLSSMMTAYPIDMQVQNDCCRLLGVAAESMKKKYDEDKKQRAEGDYHIYYEDNERDTRRIYRTIGMVHVQLVAAMRAFSNNEEIQRYGCMAIINVASLAPKTKAHFVGVGAIRAVVGAMDAFPMNAQIQTMGCHAVALITVEIDFEEQVYRNIYSAKSTDVTTCVEEAQYVYGVVLRAMQRFSTSEQQQYYGLKALNSILSWEVGTNTMAVAVVDLDEVCQVIFSVAREFADIQYLAYETFKFVNTENIDHFMRAGVVDVVSIETTGEYVEDHNRLNVLLCLFQKDDNLLTTLLVQRGMSTVIGTALLGTESCDLIKIALDIVSQVFFSRRIRRSVKENFAREFNYKDGRIAGLYFALIGMDGEMVLDSDSDSEEITAVTSEIYATKRSIEEFLERNGVGA